MNINADSITFENKVNYLGKINCIMGSSEIPLQSLAQGMDSALGCPGVRVLTLEKHQSTIFYR